MEYNILSTPSVGTERYRAILQAAERLFVEKGYHTVSVEQIADAAGVSKGLIHYHFNSKEQLLVWILKDMLDKLFANLDAIAQSVESSKTKISKAIIAYLDMVHSWSGLMRIAFFEEALTEETKRNFVSLAEKNVMTLIGLVEEGIAKGEFRMVNSRMVANLITGAILEVMRETVLQNREIKPGEVSIEITDIIFGGINS